MTNLKSSLLPGLEAFLEDGDVNITNTVEVPANEVEAIADESDAATIAAEGENISSEATETAVKAETLSTQLDRLMTMRDHVRVYGVDRSFLSLCNANGELSDALGIRLPSCESFDAVGSPSSRYSRACMEAIGGEDGIIAKIKKFCMAIWNKIKDYAAVCMSVFRKIFDRTESNMLRLRKLHEDSKLDENKKDEEVVTWVPDETDCASIASVYKNFELLMGIFYSRETTLADIVSLYSDDYNSKIEAVEKSLNIDIAPRKSTYNTAEFDCK